MKIEHIAFNVSQPQSVAAWYCEHLGLEVARHIPQPNQTHFLADGQGTILEIYCNPPDQVPDYRNTDPLIFHLAFASRNPPEDAAKLISAGASLVTDLHLPDGSHLMMLRDPWGVAFQLCKRAVDLLKDPTHKQIP